MRIWGITGGRRGNDVLVEGVANALARTLMSADDAIAGEHFRLIHTDLKAPWRWLAPYRPALMAAKRDQQIAPPYPDMVLASGRQAVPHARYIRHASGGRTFVGFLQNPHIDAAHFDFVWAPQHDAVRDPAIMQTLLSPHGLTPQILHQQATQWRPLLLPPSVAENNRKVVTVSIGGPSKAYAFDEATFTRLASQLQDLARQGCFLLITLSRRSPASYEAILRQHIGPEDGFIWDNQGDNPYQAMLGLADHLIVTADSANMVGEACLPGKPVQVFELPGGSPKFQRFHAALRQHDYVRPFTGSLEAWPVQSQNATTQIATKIALAYAAHKSSL